MNKIKELLKIDKDLIRLDRDASQQEQSLVRLTRWIIALTIVMIFIGIIQLLVMWPKRSYCVDVTSKVQICEPDYYPFDKTPGSPAYEIDQKFGS